METEKNEIRVQNALRSRIYEKETETDFTLPDYLANIERPIGVRARPGTATVSFEGDKATVKCAVVYNLLYETDYRGTLKSVEFTGEYSQKTDLKKENAEYITAHVTVESAVCKMLNPRKMLIRAHAVCEVHCTGDSVYTVVAPCQGVCMKTLNSSMARVTMPQAKEYNVSETFSLPNGMMPIAETVFSDCQTRSCSAICANGYVTVNGELEASVIYAADNGELVGYTRKVPYTFTIDEERASDTSQATARTLVTGLSADSALDAYGESRDISFNCDVSVALTLYSEDSVVTVSDAFVPGHRSETKSQEIICSSEPSNDRFGFGIEHLSENRAEFTSILDSTVSVRVAEMRESDGTTALQALANVSVIGMTAQGAERSDFTAIITEQLPVTGICDIDAQVNNSSVTLTSKGLMLKADGAFVCYSAGQKTVVCLSELNEGEERTNPHAFSVFFPSEGESLWDIAKLYSRDEAAILKDNPDSFRNGVATGDAKIIIAGNR